MLPLIQVFISFLLITSSWSHEDHVCHHDKIDHTYEYIDIGTQEILNDRVLQSQYQNIRISYDFTGGVFGSAPVDFQSYIKNMVLPPVENILEGALKIIPVSGYLTTQLTSICGGTITVPPLYNNPGVTADLVLFVDVVNDPKQYYTAFASACVMDNAIGRPIFGRVVFNMAKVTASVSNVVIEKDISVTLHETTHALGFSSGLFSTFWNPVAKTVLQNHVFSKVVNNQTITVINLAPLTTRLRNHFNCSTLEGAYLENEGSTGSRGSHFERRILYNDYMTASTVKDARISEFSLAFLEGTGWYQVDYSFAEVMTWGKGKGCDFLDKPCVSSTTKTGRFAEYCSPLTKLSCSWTGRGAGPCGSPSIMVASGGLSPSINYWGNGTVINDQFADNCPINDVYSNLDCEDEGNQLTSTLPTMEYYGVGGKCFIGTLIQPGMITDAFGYCFKSSCVLQSTGTYYVKVTIGTTSVACYNNSQISVPGLSGKLYCPDPNDFCVRQSLEGSCRRGCSARGTCVNKVCQCQDGWGLSDCGRKQYKDNCARCSNKDPLRTSCFGDDCVCNPSNATCAATLGITLTASTSGLSTSINLGGTTLTASAGTTLTGSTGTTSTTSTGSTNTTSTGSTNTTSSGTTKTNTTSTNSTSTGTTSTGTTTTGSTSTTGTVSTTTTQSTTTFTNGTKYIVTNTTTINGTQTVIVLNETTITTSLISVVTTIKITTTTITVYPNGSKSFSTYISTSTSTTYLRSNYESNGADGVSRDNPDSPNGSAVEVITSSSDSLSVGAIIGIVVGGVAILAGGIFIGIKCGKRLYHPDRDSSRKLSKKKSFANPQLQRQMTNNTGKYENVPETVQVLPHYAHEGISPSADHV